MSVNLGDQVRISYALTDHSAAAYEPSGGRVVFSLWYPGVAVTASASVTKQWIQAGGGDAELVRDSLGNWHIIFTTLQAGTHICKFQTYSGTAVAANSIEVSWLEFTVL